MKQYYYYCNKAGKYQNKGSHVNHIKAQDSCKWGTQCSEHIKAFEDQITQLIQVEYCFYYHNYDTPLPHLHENVYDSVNGNITRDKLVTIQDISI